MKAPLDAIYNRVRRFSLEGLQDSKAKNGQKIKPTEKQKAI
jgi:hypothetical protein